ncbi:MAG TPA: VanW family protein, partial [Candidatus Limnocylindrales bacterium]|nr:VanW family protein [Candidatus Limnocylindrales bacterium]
VDQPSLPGRLDIDPGTLGVDVVAPVRGRVLNQRATAAAIISGLRRHDEAATALPVKTAPGVDQAEVQAVGRQARVYLRKPLRLAGARRPLVVPPRRLAGVLDLEFADSRGATAVRLGVQSRPLAALVDRLAARTDRVAENAGVTTSTPALTVEEKLDLSWRPRPATVQVQRARHGRRLRRSAAAEAITEAVREGRHTASLPVQAARPEVTTAAARRVRSLLATFTTRFECCQPRVTNIQTMARTVDNSVVSVGRQFSLNRIVGPRTRAKGYLPAPFIADGKIIPSVGGGVSQFSTTMYNAAYLAGLQLDFHQPHSFYIDRYPPGREATLDYPSIDLTWTNDTDAPVVVRSSSTDTSITISLYGESGGRRVRAQSGPRQRPPGHDFALTVTRSIRYRGGRVVRQPYTTTYDRPPETE